MKRFTLWMVLLTIALCACQKEYSPESQDATQKSQPERLWMVKTPKQTTKANAPKNKTWWPGQTIKIKFLNGNSNIQQKVKNYAEEWLSYAGIQFEYVDSSVYADVKIAFDYNDSYIAWSTIGIDCKTIPQNEPSLNFVWLQDETDNSIIKAEVLRAFGLVLGLTYEHQNPNSTLAIKPTADIATEYNIPESLAAEIRQQYIEKYIDHTTYDKSSIMVLDIPRSLLVNPREYIPSNKILSNQDMSFIAQLYPKSTNKRTTSIAISTSSTIYVKGWMKVYARNGSILAEFNQTSWNHGVKRDFVVNTGDQIYIVYEFYFSRNGSTIIKDEEPYITSFDQGIPYPSFDYSTGALKGGAYLAQPTIVTSLNYSFSFSVDGTYKPH